MRISTEIENITKTQREILNLRNTKSSLKGFKKKDKQYVISHIVCSICGI